MNNKNLQKTTRGMALQNKVATLLASGVPISTIANKCNVNRTTIYKWMEQESFNELVQSLQAELCQATKYSMFDLSLSALGVLKQALNSKDENMRVKVAMWLMNETKHIIRRDFVGLATQRQD